MSFDRILCLANSYKHDHRCVAGISLITKQWVRLVGRSVPGGLTVDQTCYSDGREAAPLDVFEAELDDRCGSNAHPEDVYVAATRWRLLRRFDEPCHTKHVVSFIGRRPSVLQGYTDRVSAERVIDAPRERSLELIQPEDLWWWIREDRGKRKNRAFFRVSRDSRVRYDLSVTDPTWLKQLYRFPAGIYPHAFFFAGNPPKTLLTMSLTEPFERFHYKIVAGVVNLPS